MTFHSSTRASFRSLLVFAYFAVHGTAWQGTAQGRTIGLCVLLKTRADPMYDSPCQQVSNQDCGERNIKTAGAQKYSMFCHNGSVTVR